MTFRQVIVNRWVYGISVVLQWVWVRNKQNWTRESANRNNGRQETLLLFISFTRTHWNLHSSESTRRAITNNTFDSRHGGKILHEDISATITRSSACGYAIVIVQWGQIWCYTDHGKRCYLMNGKEPLQRYRKNNWIILKLMSMLPLLNVA
jgi:hypothetical protein